MTSVVILIVDDQALGRQALQSLLLNQGYELAFAENGQEALVKATALQPDLILLDVMMPEMDGFEVCRRLRADPRLAEVPVLMVTALDDKAACLRGLEAGADDFVVKPFDRDELRARVRTVTRLNRYRKLHAERAQVAWVVERSEDGYVWLDADDRILNANPQARLFLGLEAQGLSPDGLSFLEVARRHYRPGPPNAWGGWPLQMPAEAAQRRYLVRPETAEAAAFWLEVTTLSLAASAGGPPVCLVRLRDVTERVSERRDMRGFHAAIHHKLRTPLVPIVSGLQILATAPPTLTDEDRLAYARLAWRGAERLQAALEDILQFADLRQVDRSAPYLALAEFPELVATVAAEVGVTEVALAIAPQVAEARLSLSRHAWSTVLWELMENAHRYHPTRTPHLTITVAPGAAAGEVCVCVADDGQTLSPEHLAKVWTPYYQGEREFSGQWPGMGLGLSVVAALVMGVGGQGRLYNREPGPGVVVELTLPAAPATWMRP